MTDPPAAPTAAGRAWLVIAKPLATVRAQFFDVEHAIAKQIYHGVKLSWADEDGGAAAAGDSPRRMRRELTVMDRAITDDVVVEEGERGEWVQRFVEGHNAGARLVAHFFAETADEAAGGAEQTRIDLEAFAPPAGLQFGLGKLSALGLDKILKKMLAEHQKALEGYDPKARRSWVARAFEEMDDLVLPLAKLGQRERNALVATLLEAASVVAVADSYADDEERAVLDEVARILAHTKLDQKTRARLVSAATVSLEKLGMQARCDALGARLRALSRTELGLSIAVLVAEASHGIDPPELAALQKMARAGGLSEAGLRAILKRVDEGLDSVRPPLVIDLAAKKVKGRTSGRSGTVAASKKLPPTRVPPPLPLPRVAPPKKR